MIETNLQQLMLMHGNISVSDLARLAKVPQPTLHHILSGTTKNPRRKSLEALACFFSISVAQLQGREPLPNRIPEDVKNNYKISTIPLIEWELLKSWPHCPKNTSYRNILLDKKISRSSFALKVIDDTLEPMFPKNALLIFDSDKKISDRDFIIIHSHQSDNVTFNRLFIENHNYFIKYNLEDGNAKLIKIDLNTDRILGVLIEVRIQY